MSSSSSSLSSSSHSSNSPAAQGSSGCCEWGEPDGKAWDYWNLKYFTDGKPYYAYNHGGNDTTNQPSSHTATVICGDRWAPNPDFIHVDRCLNWANAVDSCEQQYGQKCCYFYWTPKALGRDNVFTLPSMTSHYGIRCATELNGDTYCCGAYPCSGDGTWPETGWSAAVRYIGCRDWGGMWWPTPAANYVYHSGQIDFGIRQLSGNALSGHVDGVGKPPLANVTHGIDYAGYQPFGGAVPLPSGTHCAKAYMTALIPPGGQVVHNPHNPNHPYLIPGASYAGTLGNTTCAECIQYYGDY